MFSDPYSSVIFCLRHLYYELPLFTIKNDATAFIMPLSIHLLCTYVNYLYVSTYYVSMLIIYGHGYIIYPSFYNICSNSRALARVSY
jgi:hypothetical protein